MKKDSFAFPIIFMALITAISVFILAFMDQATAERVEILQETDLRTKILYAFDIPVETTDPIEIEALFDSHIKEEVEGEDRIFILKENGEDKGYAFPVRGPGLWGGIDGYVAITPDYSKLMGIVFVKHEETPGLGGRIEEEAYLSQFRDLALDNSGGDYIVYRPSSNGNVDAIAGATLTSLSVSKLLNEDITNFIELRKGE